MKKPSIKRFWRGDGGATAIEYCLIAAGIGGAIVTVVFMTGDATLGLFESVPSMTGDE